MSLNTEGGVLAVHPLAVIRYSDEASAAGLEFHLEDRGARVDRILDELFDDRAEVYNDLTGLDLMDLASELAQCWLFDVIIHSKLRLAGSRGTYTTSIDLLDGCHQAAGSHGSAMRARGRLRDANNSRAVTRLCERVGI